MEKVNKVLGSIACLVPCIIESMNCKFFIIPDYNNSGEVYLSFYRIDDYDKCVKFNSFDDLLNYKILNFTFEEIIELSTDIYED